MRLLLLILLFSISAHGQVIRANAYYRPMAGSSCDVDAQKFIDSAGITDQTQKDAICNLVKDLKDSSLWSSMVAIYPFVGGTASTHKWNLKDPQNTDASFRLTFNGGWSHTSSGADPNGSTGYANTYLTPSVSLSQNSLHLSAYATTGTISSLDCMIGLDKGGGTQVIRILGWSPNTYAEANNNLQSFSYSNYDGFFVTTRRSSSVTETYRNATTINDGTTSSTTLADIPIWIGALNLNGTAKYYSQRNLATVTIGSGLTDSQVSALNTIIERYNDALGRGIQ